MGIVLYGRPSSLPHVDIGTASSGFMRGCTYNRVSDFTNKHLWAYEAYMKGYRSTGTNVTGRIGVYIADGSMEPDDRLGYSGSFTINTASPGGEFGAAIAVSDNGPTNSAIPLNNTDRHTLGVLGTGASWAFYMQQAALLTMNNERIYNRSGLSQPPPSNWGTVSGSVEGHMVIWLVCDENEPPATPASLSPSGDTNGLTPTFTAAFDDVNENRGDYLNQFKIQVRRVSDNQSMWDTTLTANSGERTADAFSRAYGGSALSLGVLYEWRTQMSDHFGEYSAWTSWTQFTPANFGFVTLNGDPTGKIETNQPDFDGHWEHVTTEDMTIAQVRIRNTADTVTLQTGSEYNITDVPDGNDFTIPWANSGLSALAWGTSYRYQIRGKDEAAEWSEWSASKTFNTNAAPSIPTALIPTNSLPVSSPPLLRCTATDADDNVGSGLVVKARIKDSGGSVLQTRSMTLNGSVWEYQTTDPGDLPTFATYRWDAYSGDGTLWSGEVAWGSESSAVKSSEATFVYADGPPLTIDSPADLATIATSSLTAEWTTTDQQKYQVWLYETGTINVVYDSGLQTSAADSHVIPSGSYRNLTTLDLVVYVEDSTPLSSTELITIDIDYPPADSVVNVQCEAITVGNDPWPSALRWSWDTTEYGAEWQDYTIRMRAASGPDTTEFVVARITSPTLTSFTYYFPASGHQYIGSVSQTIQAGLDTLESEPVEAGGSIALGGVVLVNPANPATLRTAIRNTKERPHGRTIDDAVFQPVSRSKPTTIRGRQYVPTKAFDAQLITDRWASADTKRDELDTLDKAGGVLCYRDDKGRKEFMTMPECEITDELVGYYTAKVGLRGEHYRENV